MPRFHRKMAHPRALPRLWLFTDERIDRTSLLSAIEALPAGSGIVFRHYSLAVDDRRSLFAAVRRLARRRRLALLLAGGWRDAARCGADGWHGRSARRYPGARPLLHSAPAHDARETSAARRGGAHLIFLSPIFPTRSHAGAPTLGPLRFALLVRTAKAAGKKRAPMILALGGMDAHRARRLRAMGCEGWGAIDALSGRKRQKHVRT